VNSPPPKSKFILANFFAELTVLLVPITSRVYKKTKAKKPNHFEGNSNIAKSENAMLWQMLSRLETCIIYSCI
jgi:hypothetical protein